MPPKKGPSAHALPEEMPAGIILQDLLKTQWKLGSVIGKGGFGLIYLASKLDAQHADPKLAEHVIKIEAKSNGPLFCEMQFYQRVAKQASIQSFITANRLRYLGVPPFIATGNLEHKSKEYRFLVMPRFGTDLQKLLLENGDKFSPMVTFAVGLRMIDALHFIHDNEYVHADIKAANILQGYVKGKVIPNEVYLVDYGLASRYTVDGVHREYKEDPKRAHDGTIEFTSRDAHKGAFPSRRGDMEILGFCMLRWLSGKLPWEDNLKNAAYVASSKEKYMADIPNLVKTCLSGSSAADCIQKYLEAVQKMKYESTPSYDSLRKILLNGLEKAGQKNQWEINLQTSKVGRLSIKKSRLTCHLSDGSCSETYSANTQAPDVASTYNDYNLWFRSRFNLDLNSLTIDTEFNFLPIIKLAVGILFVIWVWLYVPILSAL